MYLLDTDHISIIQRQSDPEYSVLVKHFEEHDSGAFFVPIISFHEQVTGWNAYLNRARTVDSIVRAYAMFQRILQDFASLQIAPFDVGAANTFENLRQSKVRIGTMDLRIAAIALANDWTLLSRNSADFDKVTNLRVEDWTR